MEGFGDPVGLRVFRVQDGASGATGAGARFVALKWLVWSLRSMSREGHSKITYNVNLREHDNPKKTLKHNSPSKIWPTEARKCNVNFSEHENHQKAIKRTSSSKNLANRGF